MKNDPKKNLEKNKDLDPSNDMLGENTEQTPLAKEVKKDDGKKENRKHPKENK